MQVDKLANTETHSGESNICMDTGVSILGAMTCCIIEISGGGEKKSLEIMYNVMQLEIQQLQLQSKKPGL